MVVLAQLLHELIVLQVLAAQMQHQNGGGIGVAHPAQPAACGSVHRESTGLAAAEGMGEGVQTLDGAGDRVPDSATIFLAISFTQPTVGMI